MRVNDLIFMNLSPFSDLIISMRAARAGQRRGTGAAQDSSAFTRRRGGHISGYLNKRRI